MPPGEPPGLTHALHDLAAGRQRDDRVGAPQQILCIIRRPPDVGHLPDALLRAVLGLHVAHETQPPNRELDESLWRDDHLHGRLPLARRRVPDLEGVSQAPLQGDLLQTQVVPLLRNLGKRRRLRERHGARAHQALGTPLIALEESREYGDTPGERGGLLGHRRGRLAYNDLRLSDMDGVSGGGEAGGMRRLPGGHVRGD